MVDTELWFSEPKKEKNVAVTCDVIFISKSPIHEKIIQIINIKGSEFVSKI